MSIFGGHGVIEDFSSLPRLFRDATVNELWEGPRNVLLMQVFRDIQRASSWYPPEEFVSNVLRGVPRIRWKDLSAVLKDALSSRHYSSLNRARSKRAAQWETFCDALLRAYQNRP